MKWSLRARLSLLWLVLLATSVMLALILVSVYRLGVAARIGDARAVTQAVCESIRTQYARFVGGASSKPNDAGVIDTDFLNVLLQLTLADAAGVEGGVWHRGERFLAYAFPSYEGTGEKRDVPEAEKSNIEALAAASAQSQTTQDSFQRGTREALVLAACPLASNDHALAAWTMMRVPAAAADAFDRLRLGLALLLAFVVGSGAWVGLLLQRWSRRLAALEQALGTHPIDALPRLAPTGEVELDRIVSAVNQLSERLNAAHRHSMGLAASLAQADRLTALGRLAAGLAHEIRNPIAAMRLRAENSLARVGQDDPRQSSSLAAIIEQIDRLDELLASMLAMTQPFRFAPCLVDLRKWTDARGEALRERAADTGITLTTHTDTPEWTFDPVQLARAIDNLLLNALQHTPAGGTIALTIATRDAQRIPDAGLIMQVSDSGSGLPAAVRAHLFEPFVSERPEGTGLGLALVREIVNLHGGSVRALERERGACFEIELPWRTS